MELKKRMVNLFYKLKYRNKHLSVGKQAFILGKNNHFEGYNKIGNNSKFHGKLGYGSYLGESCKINATIGRFSCIADRVHTVSGTHPMSDFVSIHPAFYSNKKQAGFTYTEVNCFEETLYNPVDKKTTVFIGNDVWIGCDVTLIGGIKIGDGSVIAAGAVVVEDVPPYTVVGGIPAKPIKKRFTQEQIDFLLDFCWWDKDSKWLEENCSNMKNIEEFIKKHSTQEI